MPATVVQNLLFSHQLSKNRGLVNSACCFVSVKLGLCYEHSVRMFDNGLLRMIFGSKREEVTGDCRKLRNEELHYWYSSQILFG